jgi:hypothetical protein
MKRFKRGFYLASIFLIQVWDIRQWSCCNSFYVHKDYISDLTFASDSAKLLGTRCKAHYFLFLLVINMDLEWLYIWTKKFLQWVPEALSLLYFRSKRWKNCTLVIDIFWFGCFFQFNFFLSSLCVEHSLTCSLQSLPKIVIHLFSNSKNLLFAKASLLMENRL